MENLNKLILQPQILTKKGERIVHSVPFFESACTYEIKKNRPKKFLKKKLK